jgi:hypothetical protein
MIMLKQKTFIRLLGKQIVFPTRHSATKAQKEKNQLISEILKRAQVKLELYSPLPKAKRQGKQHSQRCTYEIVGRLSIQPTLLVVFFSIKFKVFIIMDLHIKKAIHGNNEREIINLFLKFNYSPF